MPYGLCAWACSALRYKLDRKYERLEADFGIGVNTVGRIGSVRFKVLDRPTSRRSASPERPTMMALVPWYPSSLAENPFGTWPPGYS